MSAMFQELDYRKTPIGELSLRARRDVRSGDTIYEIKLGEEYLMSSLFTESEVALGRLGVQELLAPSPDDHSRAAGTAPCVAAPSDTAPAGATPSGTGLHVVVGGLGLGYTARAVLESPLVASVTVVDYLEAVIDWHRQGLLPLGVELTADPRCHFVHGDFFAIADSQAGFDPAQPGRQFDAIVLDIDHSPELHLDAGNARLYQPAGLARLAQHLLPGGVFGLWSNEPADPGFIRRLQGSFSQARGENITFYNPLQDRDFTQSVYLARK
ncbi:spermidine synthase [Spirochaeta africana]|uniref:Spermidine synthase n=1 Tax=Spirochaeta africana (strain ATCC 700263 / DSM 8902 / Z-7692) TaxID=889378 RepID=H9ULH2_SPIAZ|nr:spermidine synthase [Spirochaeta africana]AFG38365.1 spermidine synthase [Spirochaeta africana DSM 8902]